MPNPVKMTRPKNAKAPFEFFNMDHADQPGRINIYDEIGQTWWDEGITGKAFASELSAIGNTKDIKVYISSNGGDVKDGTVIYNSLLNHQGKVEIIIDGWAISIASVIAMAGDTVEMSNIGMMMIHKPMNVCQGNANDMRKNADLLDKVESALTNAYTFKTELSTEQVAEMLNDETWMTASEALSYGFIDNITEEPGTEIRNSFNVENISNYKNVPESVLSSLKNKDESDVSDNKESDQNIDDDLDVDSKAEDEESNEQSKEDEVNSSDNKPEITETETENARVIEIMNQCKALGLEHMAMDLIKNKTSAKDAGTILSNVKAGIDSNNQTNSQHHSNLEEKKDIQASWGSAFKKFN